MKAVLELSNKACRASGSCVVCTKASLGDLCLAYHLLPLLGVCFNCFVDGGPLGMAPSSVVGPLKTCDGPDV